MYTTAHFWADKVVTLTGDSKDTYWLAQCMFLQKQYHRAINLLKRKNLVNVMHAFSNIVKNLFKKLFVGQCCLCIFNSEMFV